MYIPSTFRELRLGAMHALVCEHPLGLLVTSGAGGLMATQIPFLIDADEGEHGTLRAHIARANPHWKELSGVAECLVAFQGEQGYVTPSWYPSKDATHEVVPTWNYVAVQVFGVPRIVEDAAWLRRQIDDLTHSQEQRRIQPWKPSDAPEAFIEKQMKAIVGIEIPISRIEGKRKMSQNRLESDRLGVIAGLRDERDPHRNVAMADLVADCLRSTPTGE
jgi:transcriptional regulator